MLRCRLPSILSQRILALTGPSGIGKTATIRALAASSSIEIVEWKNGLDDWKLGDSEAFVDGKVEHPFSNSSS